MRILLWFTLLPLVCCAGDTRSVRPVSTTPTTAAGPFDKRQSAALFVGVSANDLKYTVDDAIDVAYAMSMDKKVGLVNPRRVALVIGGKPVKAETQARLEHLEQAGAAIVYQADRATIARLAEEQARAAGPNGALIFFFASHGFSHDGTVYLLASDSRFYDSGSSLSASKLFAIAEESPSRRSLIFIDACRERVPAGARGPAYHDEPGTAPMIEAMSPHEGQVVFFGAAFNYYAFEDHRLRQGVFTSALLDGLACRAGKYRGFVTAETLAAHVEKRVRAWIQQHRDSGVRKATQAVLDVNTRSMPLAFCTPPPEVDRVAWSEASVTAFDRQKNVLWTRELPATISQVDVADLDDDKFNDVVVAAGPCITVFDADGTEAWSQSTGEGFRVAAFVVDHLYSQKQKKQLVVLANAQTTTSRVVIYDHDGSERASYLHHGQLEHVTVDKLTARHHVQLIITGTRDGAAVNVQGPVRTLFALDRNAKEEWYGALLPNPLTIGELLTIDYDNDSKRDIRLQTSKGTIHLTFDGKTLQSEGPQFVPIAKR